MDEWMNRWMDGWLAGGRMALGMYGWGMDGRMDGCGHTWKFLSMSQLVSKSSSSSPNGLISCSATYSYRY